MNLKTLISQEELEKRIKEIAEQITEEYENKELIIICILTGAVYFATDLTKYIKNDTLKIDFMKVSSYGNSTESTGEIKIKKENRKTIKISIEYNFLVIKSPKFVSDNEIEITQNEFTMTKGSSQSVYLFNIYISNHSNCAIKNNICNIKNAALAKWQ